MVGFEALAILKERMVEPVFTKRRHFGCVFCGTTFYGKYSKEPTTEYSISVGLVDEGDVEVYFPPCPNKKCGDGQSCIGVESAKVARHEFEKAEKKRKRAEERQRKKDEEYRTKPYKVTKRLTYPSKMHFDERVLELAESPEKMTKHEMMSDYFLDRVFWAKFGKGCHTMEVRNFTIRKKLYNGTYMSNSGKTRMGGFTPYFIITNKDTGKVREIGTDSVRFEIELKTKYGTNRRNDPERGYGLPNSRGYR